MPKPTGSTSYRFIGPHATVLEAGTPLGPGDFIDLDETTGHDQRLVDEGWLIEVDSVNPQATKASTKKEDDK